VRKAREVLNELRWRAGRDLRKAEVWIRGRGADEKAIGGDEITDLGRRYFSTATATIPYYKVVRIVYDGAVVFER
jgi:uncharacterized protein (UPF0248 family)